MNEFLGYLIQSIPFLLAFGFALLVITLAVFASTRPMLVVYPILLTIFLVSDISYGKVDDVSVSLLSRGAGVLVFPAFVWTLLLTFVWIKFAGAFASRIDNARVLPPVLSLTPWFAAWALLLCGHLAVAVFTGVPFRDAVGAAGFSNLLWTWLMLATLMAAMRTGDDMKWLLRFLLVVGLGRAVFGLVRWAAFGGDPVNAYGNRHGLDLKLTFFDIYDSLVCMLTITVAAMKLFTGTVRSSAMRTAFLWLAIVLPALCIVLSFRRTAQVGFLIAGIFVLTQLPKGVRWWLALGAIPAALIGGGYAVWKRLSQTRQAGGASDLFWDIMPKTIGPDSPRFIELKFAWESFLDHPIFGVGSWGNYEGWRLVSWQLDAGGGGTYLHSGVLHLGLKSGLVGMVLLIGLVLTFVLHWRLVRGMLKGNARVLAVAGVAGCIFVIPDFVISTAFTKHRTVLFIGLCMSFPYVAAALSGGLHRLAPQNPGRLWNHAGARRFDGGWALDR